MTELEKIYLKEKIMNIFNEKGFFEDEKIYDDFKRERNLEEEINEYIEAFGEG